MNLRYFIIVALLLLTSCLKEDELKRPFVSYDPPESDDGWQVSSPENENIDSVHLQQIYREFHADKSIWQVRSMLVFRNGKLVAESYTKDDQDRTVPRAIWSCTKQVMGILTGIAIEKQIIHSVDDPISDYLPQVAVNPDKAGITIAHLLTMKSGIKYSNDGLSGQTDDILRQLPDSITDFILSRSLAYQPGDTVIYKDCDPQLVASVINENCGASFISWAREVLLDPLQISNLEWTNYKDGTPLGGFGILTTPREMAKFGQCVLDSGKWNGIPVVSSDWIREMLTTRVDDIYGYEFGYLWWKDPSRDMIFMSGHGGQYVCIVPAKRLMVVMTAEVNTQGEFQFGRDAFEWVDRVLAATD